MNEQINTRHRSYSIKNLVQNSTKTTKRLSLPQWNLRSKGRKALREIRAKCNLLSEWFQHNKEWIDDVLTVFFSGLLIVNVFTFLKYSINASKAYIIGAKRGYPRELRIYLKE